MTKAGHPSCKTGGGIQSVCYRRWELNPYRCYPLKGNASRVSSLPVCSIFVPSVLSDQFIPAVNGIQDGRMIPHCFYRLRIQIQFRPLTDAVHHGRRLTSSPVFDQARNSNARG